jgi:hypothetical protein
MGNRTTILSAKSIIDKLINHGKTFGPIKATPWMRSAGIDNTANIMTKPMAYVPIPEIADLALIPLISFLVGHYLLVESDKCSCKYNYGNNIYH